MVLSMGISVIHKDILTEQWSQSYSFLVLNCVSYNYGGFMFCLWLIIEVWLSSFSQKKTGQEIELEYMHAVKEN